jgi:serine/threonine protein kinase
VSEERQELVANVREGDLLAGKYRVQRVLGVGGMGVVVAARHTQLDTPVAIKFLLPEMLANAAAVARFAREARAASKITSEHVARVFDVGALENGAPYIVMELLEGMDLLEMLRERGPLSPEQAIEFILQTCVAVADAHALGIVHRDLKPANLFCTRRSDGEPVIKVLDFGISKLTDVGPGTPGVSVTQTAAIMGSPLYMSPEQMRSAKDVDARTDIWALGVILFQLVTGEVPFSGETMTEVAIKVATEPTPNLRAMRTTAPAGLEEVIFRCLEKAPRARYQNVAELAHALSPFASATARPLVERISGTVRQAGRSTPPTSAAPPPRVTTAETAVAPATDAPWTAPRGERRSTRKARTIASALGILAVAGAAVTWRFARPDEARVPEPPPPATAAAAGTARAAGTASTPALETDVRATVPELPALAAPAPLLDAGGAAAPASTRNVTAPPALRPAQAPPVPSPAGSKRASPPPQVPKPDCDPPYTLDDQGQKHFKHECYR